MSYRKLKELTDNGDGTFSVPLSRGMFAIIDEIDADRVGLYNWCAAFDGYNEYAQRTIPVNQRIPGGPCVVKLHRFILGLDGPMIDHKDGDGLNNRRSNLRHATYKENSRNRDKDRTNKSGYKGVHFHKGIYEAYIHDGEKQRYVGGSKNPVVAARKYDEAARKLHGEFAKTNFPIS